MTEITILQTKSCVPCQEGAQSLDQQEINILLASLSTAWEINNVGHLYKAYAFYNFISAMSFANKIAVVAEHEGHHPNLMVAWGLCAVEIWTHKINGLTESDFILAAKIDGILNE